MGPAQIRHSGRVASWLDANLPKSISTFVTFYESWVAKLGTTPRTQGVFSRLRRPIAFLLIDATMLVAVVIGASTASGPISRWLSTKAGLEPKLASWTLIGAAALVGGLFALGIVRRAVQVARLLAAQMIPGAPELVLPEPANAIVPPPMDLGRAPRRALVVTIELAIVLVIGLPIAVITQPFVPGGGIVILGMIGVLALIANRSITDFSSHVRAGSTLIVEVLARQASKRAGTEDGITPQLSEVEAMLPGFSGLTPILLNPAAAAVGRSLAELDLRAKTGASVLAITREGEGNANPSPKDLLRAGDVLAVAGSAEAVAAARELLLGVVTNSTAPSHDAS
jgi:CPA2 family monovalent cation:H+ antiporter-2